MNSGIIVLFSKILAWIQQFFWIGKTIRKTPSILQMEATECGSVCLSIILSYYGHNLLPEEARSVCGVSRDGSKASYILRGARHYNMDAHGYSVKDLKALDQCPWPCIIHWGFEHFVVFEGRRGQFFYINDPAVGRRRLSQEEFSQYFTGVVLTFVPKKGFVKKRQKSPLTTFFSYAFRGGLIGLGAAVILGILQILPSLIIAGSSKVFIDYILIKSMHQWLPPLMSVIGVAVLCQIFLILIHKRLLARLQLHFQLSLASKVIHHLFYLPLSFFDQRFAGDILFRLSSIQRLSNLVSLDIMGAFINIISIALFSFLLYVISPPLLGIILLFLFLRFLAILLFRQSIRDRNAAFIQESSKVSGIEVNGLASLEMLKANNLESTFFRNWSSQHDEALNAFQKMTLVDQQKNLILSFLTGLMTLFLLYQGTHLVMAGEITVGTLMAFLALTHFLDDPLLTLLNFTSDLEKIKASIYRLHDILLYHPSSSSKFIGDDSQKKIDIHRLNFGITLKDISFGYAPLDPPLFHSLNMVIPKEKVCAVVGASGAGKSTISKLVCGLYPPTGGEIFWDNTPLSTLTDIQRSKLISLVDQDIFFFEGTVRDNLTSWNPHKEDAHLLQILHHVGLYDDLLGRGLLEAPVAENGTNFSGGQRQRLEIARALAGQPELLILDEATSALDALSEKQIFEALGKTSLTLLIIAHRLSTIRQADIIYVIHEGKVVQCGQHSDLMTQKGPYHDLVMMEENA
jgi:NHLM bacteriocin system ABC transporter peptidase/ATP-binding protein